MQHFINIAKAQANKSTCINKKGAVLVKDNKIIATGYNRAGDCKKGCLRQQLNLKDEDYYEQCRGIDAIQAILTDCARQGINVEGAELYSTSKPCMLCKKLLINAGVDVID